MVSIQQNNNSSQPSPCVMSWNV